MASWRAVGRPLRGPTGKLIRRGSRRWQAYFGRHPDQAARAVTRKGRTAWQAGYGWLYWPGRDTDLPRFIRPMRGRDLGPMVASIEGSNRIRPDKIRFVSMRFLVTREGVSDGGDVDPGELAWVGGGHRLPLSDLREDLLPMSREELQQEALTYCGPLVTRVTAIYSVSVQMAN